MVYEEQRWIGLFVCIGKKYMRDELHRLNQMLERHGFDRLVAREYWTDEGDYYSLSEPLFACADVRVIAYGMPRIGAYPFDHNEEFDTHDLYDKEKDLEKIFNSNQTDDPNYDFQIDADYSEPDVDWVSVMEG